MKKYTIFLRFMTILCIVAIVLTVINYFTGFINSTMTGGASVICLILAITVLSSTLRDYNREKNK